MCFGMQLKSERKDILLTVMDDLLTQVLGRLIFTPQSGV